LILTVLYEMVMFIFVFVSLYSNNTTIRLFEDYIHLFSEVLSNSFICYFGIVLTNGEHLVITTTLDPAETI
jgi:hypothetical protein